MGIILAMVLVPSEPPVGGGHYSGDGFGTLGATSWWMENSVKMKMEKHVLSEGQVWDAGQQPLLFERHLTHGGIDLDSLGPAAIGVRPTSGRHRCE